MQQVDKVNFRLYSLTILGGECLKNFQSGIKVQREFGAQIEDPIDL